MNSRKISILLILTLLWPVSQESTGFDQFHGFIVLDEEKKDGHDRPGKGHQAEGMPPAPMLGHEAAEADADGDAEGNGDIPETHHAGTLFRGKQTGEHGRAGGGVPGLADADAGAGHEQLGEALGEGAGGRGSASRSGP